MNVVIKPQKDFPFYTEYERNFPITADTIFVFKDTIFADNEIPYDVFYHELKHLEQQNRIGPKKWIKKYIKDKDFRLEQEIEAYRHQLKTVKKTGDRQEYANILVECAKNISSPLYNNIISYRKALKLLVEV
jgi:hypothetical protein